MSLVSRQARDTARRVRAMIASSTTAGAPVSSWDLLPPRNRAAHKAAATKRARAAERAAWWASLSPRQQAAHKAWATRRAVGA